MAMITGAFLFIASVITAALSTLLAEEIKAWSPWIIRRIISFSVARLPENLRERFGEEWESHVGEVPGEVGKLLTSVGFLLAVPGMTLSIRREEFVGRMQRNLDQMDHLFLTATSVVNTIQADSFLLSVKDVTDPMDRLVRHLGTMEGERQKMAKSIEFVTHAQNNLLIAAIGTIGNRILDRNYKQLMEQIEAADAANKRIVGVMSRLQSRKAIGLSDKSV